MNLTYNGISLNTFGVVQILGQSRKRLPEAAPQYEENTLKVRIDSFQDGYADNAANITALRATFKTQHGTLLMTDPVTSAIYVNRPVTVQSDDEPEDGRAPLSGTSRQALSFTFTWQENDVTGNAVGATYQRSGGTLINLGEVHGFSDRYSSNLIDEMRSARRRAGGVVSVRGRYKVNTNQTLAVRRAALQATRDAMMAELKAGKDGRLIYGTFDQVVRMTEFTADVDQPNDQIMWSLTASWTRFPNESDYAVAEINLNRVENKEEGTVTIDFSGTIGAPNEEAAIAKLAVLRGTFIPVSFARRDEKRTTENVIVDSDGSNDSTSFLKMTFSESWQQHSGDVLAHTLKVTDADDTKTGHVRTTYAGTVTAQGADDDAAYITALARVETLAADKYPHRLSYSVDRTDHQILTTGAVIMTVTFNYEYQRKGARTYYEVKSELSTDYFGQNTESVSGFVIAPTLAQALATYTTSIRDVGDYIGALILNERKPTKNLALIVGVSGSSQDDRFDFSFTVRRTKPSGDTSIEYRLSPENNFTTLEKTTTVSGTVFAVTEAAAVTFLDAFLDTFSTAVAPDFRALLGKRTQSKRTSQNQQGPKVGGGAKADAFLALEFSETFVGALTGADGILKSECAEELQYTGDRLIEKPLPDGVGLVQKVGRTMGSRTVSGSVTATTESGARAYATQCRALLLVGFTTLGPGEKYEAPPRETTNFKFLPLVDGHPRGSGANVNTFEMSFTFSELIPDFPRP